VAAAFILLTVWAASDVRDNVIVHLGPPKVSSDQFDRFVLTEMAGDLRVVLGFEHLGYYSLWDPKQEVAV
jgi:hypothetical protein